MRRVLKIACLGIGLVLGMAALAAAGMTAADYFNRGLAHQNKGEYDQAIANYTKAIELKPDFAEAYNNRGNVYDDMGKYDLAIADETKAIELDPEDAGHYNNRGVAYKDKGEYDKAIADYNKAIELKPDYAEAYLNRGVSYYLLGKFLEAIDDFKKVTNLKTPIREYAFLWWVNAAARLAPGGEKEALAALAAYVKAHTSSAWIRTVSRFYLGEIDEAAVLAEAARGATPRETRERQCEAYYYLGEARFRAGDTAGAKAFFEKCLATNVTTFLEYHSARALLKRMRP